MASKDSSAPAAASNNNTKNTAKLDLRQQMQGKKMLKQSNSMIANMLSHTVGAKPSLLATAKSTMMANGAAYPTHNSNTNPFSVHQQDDNSQ